ncbi:transposable element tcb2 transposase [Trichonephila clavipes]|nr:transposable element tcb2 transposase [Trichonephila clavipes]
MYRYGDNLMNPWTLQCSPKSSGVNIIEDIRDALQRAVQKESPPPLTTTDLWTAAGFMVCQLPPALLLTLKESMPRHIKAFLCARVGPTRYQAGVLVFSGGIFSV